jgi:hypothetical protein
MFVAHPTYMLTLLIWLYLIVHLEVGRGWCFSTTLPLPGSPRIDKSSWGWHKILLAHNLHPSKRKDLGKWLGVMDSMSALRKVWQRAFLEALVCLQPLYNNLD